MDPDDQSEVATELARLRAENAQYRSLIAAMQEGVVVQDVDGSIFTCNQAAQEILGLTADQLTGRTSLDPRWRAVHEDGAPFPGATHPAMVTLRTGAPCRDVVMGVHKPDGQLTWIEINSEPVPTLAGEAPRVVCTFNDVTAYRKTLHDLRATDDRLRLALRAARMGAWEWQIDEGRVLWSDAAEEVLDLPQGALDGRVEAYPELVHADDRPRVRDELAAALAGGPERDTVYLRHRVVGRHGERWIDSHARIFRDPAGRPLRLAGVALDVTEARRLEVEARHAQRLDAIGRLAGGIAHDFNNVLTAISSAVALASRPDRDPGPHLAVIRDAAERAAQLTRQLLAFARQQPIGMTTVDLGELVHGLHPLLGHLVGERIELSVEVAPGRWGVRADQGQLEQVLLNLVANARDAIHDAGRLRITVGVAASADQVALTVEDDGVGMPSEVLEHVFEPFFTTKASGTGLGLATSYGIIQQHGGRIEIRSQVGRGTRIEITLQRDRDPMAAPPPPAPAASRPCTETLLLVEDDALIRRVAERILTEQGYRVLVAADGVDGLELARQHLGDLALVLTDVVMPRLGGVALVRALRALRPRLPVLLMSGYQPETYADGDAEPLPLLDKPYSPDQLLQRIRELLDR